MSKRSLRINEEIAVTEVRLIGADSEQIGVIPIAEAMQRAQDEEYDLVEISPNAAPPVCRLMDYGKYKYQQQKRLTDQRKRGHSHEVKQIRIKTFRIDPHDLGIKLKKSREFIEDGHRLLITLMFRARENQHAELGHKLMIEGVAKGLEDVAKIESMPRKDGRRMTMTLAPVSNLSTVLKSRAAKKASEEESKNKEKDEPESVAEVKEEPAVESPAESEADKEVAPEAPQTSSEQAAAPEADAKKDEE